MLHPETLPLSRAFAEAGVMVWLMGGQAVEVWAAQPVRPHDDIDWLVRASDGPAALALLERLGFVHAHGSLESGNVFYRRGDLLVDLVPVLDDQTPPRTLGELAPVVWPDGLLSGAQLWPGETAVRVLAPAQLREMKAVVSVWYGVALRPKDEEDLTALAHVRRAALLP